MARYIDAEELTKAIEYYHEHTRGVNCTREHYAYSVALKEITRTPTADVEEVKHGEWIDVNERLPESTIEHGILIFVQKQGCKPYITLGYYWNDKFMNESMWQENYVTHWQPLPEPPNSAKMDGKDIKVPTTDGGKEG